MKMPKVIDLLIYVPTEGPHKDKRCPARVTELSDQPFKVNLDVRTRDGHFVEHVSNVPVVSGTPKRGQASFPK